eukprot:gnl/MRDRNA2_/MRDRNA2_66800_c0_seq2.p1 gnl/MRDRNA2_/MRDRNA2_66800_c0~~gnl/MRDRNA2_/MRDRNA2_66800_c0_seq2.p1  ORF type:complete len:249 (-),score=37.93 gnl/MRDRNA2_/MRDRNA2_66800_c0_seq2:439-1185(-)
MPVPSGIQDTLAKPLLHEDGSTPALDVCKLVMALMMLMALSTMMMLTTAPSNRGQHLVIQEGDIAMSDETESDINEKFTKGPPPKSTHPVQVTATVTERKLPPTMPTGPLPPGFYWKPEFRPLEHVYGPPYVPGNLTDFVITKAGIRMPRLLFSIAWRTWAKQERIAEMLRGAVKAGIRGFDTAGEPAFKMAFASMWGSNISRESVFIQARLNPRNEGPDPSMRTRDKVRITRSLKTSWKPGPAWKMH